MAPPEVELLDVRGLASQLGVRHVKIWKSRPDVDMGGAVRFDISIDGYRLPPLLSTLSTACSLSCAASTGQLKEMRSVDKVDKDMLNISKDA